MQLSRVGHCVNEAARGQLWFHTGPLAKRTVHSLDRSVYYLQLGNRSVRV